jgi:hypothetical protein
MRVEKSSATQRDVIRMWRNEAEHALHVAKATAPGLIGLGQADVPITLHASA